MKTLKKIITITLLALITSTANAAVKVGSYVGTWKASTAYAAGDLITYSNKTFLSLAKNKAKNPNSNLKVWQVLGGVGAQGIPGVQGIAGPRGAPGIPTGGTDGVGVIGLQGIPGGTRNCRAKRRTRYSDRRY